MFCQDSIEGHEYLLQGDSMSDAAPAPDDAALLSTGPAASNDMPAPVVPSPTPSVASSQVSSSNDDSLGTGEIVGIVLGVIVAIPTIGAGVAKTYTCIRGWRRRP